MILYVDSNSDDQYLFKLALLEIGCKKEVLCFPTAEKLISFLESTKKKPFIIICDLRIPNMSGIDLRKLINNRDELRKMAIPFIYISDLIKPKDVDMAYDELVQGFFRKPKDFGEFKILLNAVVYYWSRAVHPGLPDLNSFESIC